MAKEDRVSYYTLKKSYKHDLGVDNGQHFTAFNMTYGPFGGVKGRDMVLVQSIDGKLSVFEQSAHAFTVQLYDVLFPGPIVYFPKLDAFITGHYSGSIECYKYQVLASSNNNNRNTYKQEGKSQEGKTQESKLEVNGYALRVIRNSVAEWILNIGEGCNQILIGNFSSVENIFESYNQSRFNGFSHEILIVSEKSMLLIKGENGSVMQQRQFNHTSLLASCAVPYVAENAKQDVTAVGHNVILVEKDQMISIFSTFQLVWAAKTLYQPIYINVGSYGGQKGLILISDDQGNMSISFLGTKPPKQTMMSQVRDLNYDQIDEEHRHLLNIIRENNSDNKHLQSSAPKSQLVIKSQIAKTLDFEQFNPSIFNDLNPNQVTSLTNQFVPLVPTSNSVLSSHASQSDLYIKLTLRLYISYIHQSVSSSSRGNDLQNVQINIHTPDSIFVDQNQIVIPKISADHSTPLVIKITLFALKNVIPNEDELIVNASYANPSQNNEITIASHSLILPPYLFYRIRLPSKTSLYKIVLNTEYNAISMIDLFQDLINCYQSQQYFDIHDVLGTNAIQAMGFQCFVDPSTLTSGQQNSNISNNVSVLVSKNAGRYRIQGDSYAMIFYLLSELERRLNLKISSMDPAASTTTPNGGKSTPALLKSYVSIDEQLPLNEYFQLINHHLLHRIKLITLNNNLNDISQQYRLIEKRLLTRYKDRNPTPLNGLDLLLNETYQRILTIADEIEETQKLIKKLMAEIQCFTKLMVLLISLKYGMTFAERNLLYSYLCPDVNEGIEQGWEETINASLVHLLKSALNKGTKESAGLIVASSDLEVSYT